MIMVLAPNKCVLTVSKHYGKTANRAPSKTVTVFIGIGA